MFECAWLVLWGIAAYAVFLNRYKYFTIAPSMGKDRLNYAQAYIDTVRGRVLSRWDKNPDGSLT
jgi:hypothetical protein